jgi:DNA-binding MarR family transcriptional regulator
VSAAALRLMAAMRRASAIGVLLSQAVAQKAGLNPVDLECLDLILADGPASAGQIGKRTGLTSGAVTGLIDRLERAKFVRRISDAHDRRKVLVEVREDSMESLDAMFRPVNQAMTALISEYGDEDLDRFADFLEKASDASAACLGEINGLGST